MKLNNMTVTKVVSESVTICQFESVEVICISHMGIEAGISLFGGHMLWFKPEGQKEVLWLSEEAIFDKSKPIRGGVPICFPWFGNAGREQTHGFARNVDWAFLGHNVNHNGIEISLSLTSSEETLALWPHEFKNRLIFQIGKELEISLITENTSDNEWLYSGAIHTYFGVDGIEDISISGVGNKYLDGVLNYIECIGEKDMTIDSEVIRVCTSAEKSIVISDPNNERKISVQNLGHNSTVIWNPWKEMTKQINDMPDEDYKNMLCVESTIYGKAPVFLEPGKSHKLSTFISIK